MRMRSLCLILALFASIVQAITPDPADLASTKGLVVFMALVGNSPGDDEFDACVEQVCRPEERATKSILPALSDASRPSWLWSNHTSPQARLSHTPRRAFQPGVIHRVRERVESLCHLVC
jgi:hypothetical protein